MRELVMMRRLLAAAGTVAALVVAGCGSSSSSSSSNASSSGSSSLASFQQAAQAAERPTSWEGPSTSSPAAKNKTMAVILCASTAEGCVRIGNGAKEAAQALGWNVKVLDGQGQASVTRSAMLQAISQKVDGIMLVAINSKTVGDAMARARAAKIPVVSVVGGNTTGTTGSDVFAEPDARALKAGGQLGNWVVADSGGNAKIAMFHAPEFTDSVKRYNGSKQVFDQCSGCKIVSDQSYTAATAAQQIPLMIKSTLQAHPEINHVWIDIGGYGALGVQAVDELGRRSKVKLVSFDCNLLDLKNISQDNVQPACEGLALEDGGWGGVDELNRAFNNAQPASDFIPIRVITKASMPPTGKPWLGDFDFRANYKQLWKIG
jgi:ribose transport system substrate-binding protein